MAAAMKTSVSAMETAGEGGPWGQAILAGYMMQKQDGESLEKYLSDKVFTNVSVETCEPEEKDVKGFDEFIKNYSAGLAVEKAAVESLR